jgi:hypothetical protein
MSDDRSAVAGEHNAARQLRRLRRQVVLGCLLALLVLLNQYLPLAKFHTEITWLQLVVASTLAADVIRSVLLNVVLPIQISIHRTK